MILQLLFLIIFRSWPINTLAQAQASRNCTSKCGDVDIPFPFGIETGCYMDDWFAIDCNSSTPFIRSVKVEVLEISVEAKTMQVKHPVFNSCQAESTRGFVNLEGTPFEFSNTVNRFTGVSCGNLAFMSNNDSLITGCFSACNRNVTTAAIDCLSGINCCQTTIPSALQKFNASVDVISSIKSGGGQQDCKYAFLVHQNWFETNFTNLQQGLQGITQVPVILNWGIFNTTFNQYAMNKSKSYLSTSDCNSGNRIVECSCFGGYTGNPYLLEGCQDIDECSTGLCPSFMICENHVGSYSCHKSKKSRVLVIILGIGGGLVGVILLAFGVWWLFIVIKKRKEIKLKEKYFRQNGGFLLQQQLTSSDGNVDKSKLFSSNDLDKATDHFNLNRILGQGGQGTVYKGMLSDGRIVAVKKSRVLDEGKLHEFINEVVILSQINHRNIVKLLGCCLETKVPLLVYEFIPNGTLFQYLQDQNEELFLTWDMRLRIAIEVAGALSYLHSAASMPIYHRDVKSTNILLDEKHRAKVADFGTSKSIDIDQTHVTTKVLGTFGYLDPEYFQSGQFTDKSDVYSFGVILVELLTGQKPISSARSEEYKGLAAYFIQSMEENSLYDIIDAQVLQVGKKEEILVMANLAKRCLNLNGKKRPTMKEVTMVLEGIRTSQKDCNIQQNCQEVDHEYERNEIFEAWDAYSTSTGSTFDTIGLSIDVQPLLTKSSRKNIHSNEILFLF